MLGYSSRYVASELRRQFPVARIPHYTTIARWLRQVGQDRRGKAAKARWAAIVNRAGGIMIERMDEAERLLAVGVAKMYSTAVDVYLVLERSISRQEGFSNCCDCFRCRIGTLSIRGRERLIEEVTTDCYESLIRLGTTRYQVVGRGASGS